MESSFKQKISSATFWSALTEVISKLITPIVNMILARLLSPEAFGIVATLTVVTSFAEIFADAGFQKYIVQHDFKEKKVLDDYTSVAFWTNLAVSCVIFLLIYILRDSIAILVGNPGLGFSISIASLNIIITAFSSVQLARYKRDFDFRTTFFIRIITACIPLIVTVPLALVYRNYWALIIGTLVSNMVRAVALTIKSKWKPRFFFSFYMLKDMVGFCIWTLLESISIWVTSYIGTFIVGQYMSDYYLGLFKTSISTVNSCIAVITASITPVVFSTLSRCQDDKDRFVNTYFSFQRLTAIIALPLGVGLLVYNQLLTKILLGDQWLEASRFVGLVGLCECLLILFNNFNSEAFRAVGRPRVSMLVQIGFFCVITPISLIYIKRDFNTFSTVYAFARLSICLFSYICMQVLFKVNALKSLANMMPMIICSVTMGGIGWCLIQVNDSVLWHVCTVMICVIVYFTLLFGFFARVRHEIITYFSGSRIMLAFLQLKNIGRGNKRIK